MDKSPNPAGKKLRPSKDPPPITTVKAKKKKDEDRRSYPLPHVRLLHGSVANKCSFPGCDNDCVERSGKTAKPLSTGQIGHIKGVKPGSARYDPNLTKKQRDSYDNWILICGNCHPHLDELDDDGNAVHSEATVRKWKSDKEEYITRRLAKKMPDVTSKELLFIADFIAGVDVNDDLDFTVLDPTQKLAKNGLTETSSALLKSGLGKAEEVRKFIEHQEAMIPEFSSRLKSGFLEKYLLLWDEGLRGDALFRGLRLMACQYSEDQLKQAAGLAVLAYFFEACEVFQK